MIPIYRQSCRRASLPFSTHLSICKIQLPKYPPKGLTWARIERSVVPYERAFAFAPPIPFSPLVSLLCPPKSLLNYRLAAEDYPPFSKSPLPHNFDLLFPLRTFFLPGRRPNARVASGFYSFPPLVLRSKREGADSRWRRRPSPRSFPLCRRLSFPSLTRRYCDLPRPTNPPSQHSSSALLVKRAPLFLFFLFCIFSGSVAPCPGRFPSLAGAPSLALLRFFATVLFSPFCDNPLPRCPQIASLSRSLLRAACLEL